MPDDHVELLDTTTNCAVVKLPTRKFPGVVIQGDSLHILWTSVNSAKSLCEAGDISEAIDELSLVSDILASYIGNYERVLKNRSINLPY
jgi:hypothetical protein